VRQTRVTGRGCFFERREGEGSDLEVIGGHLFSGVEKLPHCFTPASTRIGLGCCPYIVAQQERRPTLVAQQIGGHQGWGDPAGLVEPGAANA
jgi:hypothetical protein